MQRNKLTIVLLDLGQRQHFVLLVPWQVLYRRRRRHELYSVGLTDNLADILRLQVFLAYVSRLVIEETVRVAHPGHPPKEHPITSKK